MPNYYTLSITDEQFFVMQWIYNQPEKRIEVVPYDSEFKQFHVKFYLQYRTTIDSLVKKEFLTDVITKNLYEVNLTIFGEMLYKYVAEIKGLVEWEHWEEE